MSGGDPALWALAYVAFATLALMWSLSLPVSDPAFSRDWEAEAAEFSVRIRPGDQWGR